MIMLDLWIVEGERFQQAAIVALRPAAEIIQVSSFWLDRVSVCKFMFVCVGLYVCDQAGLDR